jgi:hypothetical protein
MNNDPRQSAVLPVAGVGHPVGTRYPRGWRVWEKLRPDTGGGCG